MAGALPNVVVIGAMKCATSAVHAYLDAHPQVRMSAPKELNFFNGPETPPHDDPDRWWVTGQWHRGVDWYRNQFDAAFPVRGEASPAYSSPSFPRAADRMAAVVPDVRLVYLVRDPVDRAASQYAHHRREGTETRTLPQALLDDSSQYLARSRYTERLKPFLERFDEEQVHVVVQERLREQRSEELAALYRHVGADPGWHDDRLEEQHHVGPGSTVPAPLRSAVLERVRDDVEALRELLGDSLPEWGR